ncbi:hypothetical protein D3C80_1709660 [compost metagenome]
MTVIGRRVQVDPAGNHVGKTHGLDQHQHEHQRHDPGRTRAAACFAGLCQVIEGSTVGVLAFEVLLELTVIRLGKRHFVVDPAIGIDRSGLARQTRHGANQRKAVADTEQEVRHLVPVVAHDQHGDQQ